MRRSASTRSGMAAALELRGRPYYRNFYLPLEAHATPLPLGACTSAIRSSPLSSLGVHTSFVVAPPSSWANATPPLEGLI
jgi:hypothetical protein